MTINRKTLSVVVGLLILLLAAMVAAPALAGDDDEESGPHVVAFDVAEDGTRFVFDEDPVFDEDGFPAYGNSFVTQGYIYPAGTLNGSNGVLPDGSPEFPELVIGEWTCRGYFIGDGAHTASGPWVITTQVYNFGDEYGVDTIVSDGYEIADVGETVVRAVTGGSGEYAGAGGEAAQILLGFNASEGVNLQFELQVQ